MTKRATAPISYLTKAQVELLLFHAPPEPKGLPQLAFLFMWRAGLRVSEVANLKVQDIRLDSLEGGHKQWTLEVVKSKSGKPRTVPMHADLARSFVDFVTYTGRKPGEYIFTSNRKKNGVKIARPIDTSTIGRWLKIAQKQTTLETMPISNHTLRHSYARHCLLQGIPINVISLWLGHANLKTTVDTYLSLAPDPLQLIKSID